MDLPGSMGLGHCMLPSVLALLSHTSNFQLWRSLLLPLHSSPFRFQPMYPTFHSHVHDFEIEGRMLLKEVSDCSIWSGLNSALSHRWFLG